MIALVPLRLSALTVADFGTWILFDASIGLNWALWIPLATGCLSLFAWLGARSPADGGCLRFEARPRSQ
jgi:hypothetical protein